jgi:hypothetical protein
MRRRPCRTGPWGSPGKGLMPGYRNGRPMSDQPAQLALFCRGCCGSGVVVVDAPNHDGDLVAVPAPCPTCRPSQALAETWWAVATLGRRLAPETACRWPLSGPGELHSRSG